MGRPATGETPKHVFRIPDGIWKPAEAKAKAEGKTMTDVVVSALRRYVASGPAKPAPETPPSAGA